MEPFKEEYLTSLEAAARLNQKPEVLRQWRYKKQGPKFFKFSRDVFYLRSEVERFKKLLDANGRRYARCMELQK